MDTNDLLRKGFVVPMESSYIFCYMNRLHNVNLGFQTLVIGALYIFYLPQMC